MDSITEIVDKYEVPKEYHDALWAAYQEGAKRGFIKASTAQVTGTHQHNYSPTGKCSCGAWTA